MWHSKKVSVVLITRNNGETIRSVVDDAYYTGFADEVIVVDTGSNDRTISEVSYTKARVLTAKTLHDAFFSALERSEGDFVIFADPIGIIPGNQIANLLPYGSTYNAVFTTRIPWIGANVDDAFYVKMHQKFGWMITKELETVLIDDLNAPMFLLRKPVNPDTFHFENPNKFIFEIMLNVLKNGITHIQVPVQYHGSLHQNDKHLFDFKGKTQLKKAIKNIHKKFSKELIEEEHDLDPRIVKERIRNLRKKLGAFDEPSVSIETRKELDDAIQSVVSGTKVETKKLSLDDEYQMVKELDAGLHTKKVKHHRNKNTK